MLAIEEFIKSNIITPRVTCWTIIVKTVKQ